MFNYVEPFYTAGTFMPFYTAGNCTAGTPQFGYTPQAINKNTAANILI